MNPILKRIITALTLAFIVVNIMIFSPTWVFAIIASILATLATIEYAMLLKIKLPVKSAKYTLAVALGGAALFALIAPLPLIPVHFSNMMNGNLALLFVIMSIKLSDMGGFAFGLSSAKLMKNGNHKLCPTISPNKSWEGLGGSIFGSCLLTCSFMPITGFTCSKSLIIGVTAALVGTFGDLVESKFKRWVGVKDSSTMKFTNGMGGILDMLDSLLFAPIVLAILMEVL